MVSVGPLTESGAGNDADSSVLEELEGVEDVGGLAGLLGGRDRLGGEVQLEIKSSIERLRDDCTRTRIIYLGEGVHGALDRVAGEALNGVEGVGHQLGALGQRGEDGVALRHEALVGLLAGLGRVHHHVHAGLEITRTKPVNAILNRF